MASVTFYFDFSSPYSYLAALRVKQDLAPFGVEVRWRPVLMGVIVKTLGVASVPEQAAKLAYMRDVDVPRAAAMQQVPFRFPVVFPLATLLPARAVYWLEQHAPEQVEPLVMAVFQAYFVDQQDISQPAVLLELATRLGLDGAALSLGVQDPTIKEQLRLATDEALAKGVFGVPTLDWQGELFWGADRLPHLCWRLQQAG